MNWFKKRGFFWVMLALFIGSISVHWVTAWYAFVDDQQEHNQPLDFNKYLNEVIRQTAENWQSEMIQLLLQVSLIAYFLYVGSPQSKEGNERMEAKMDWIMNNLNSLDAEKFKKDLLDKYPKK